MPEENEKIEDFISLWKKKITDENKKLTGEKSLNDIESLQKENQELRMKIVSNIELISRSEEMIRRTVEEKEQLKVEKEEAVMAIRLKMNELEKEREELDHKVNSMIKLLLEKDEVIKLKEDEISQFKTTGGSSLGANDDLVNKLQSDLSKKKTEIEEFQLKISELKKENDALQEQLVEKLKSLPIDYVVPVENTEPEVLKPQPAETSTQTLEMLCQDLQADLNKYKKIVEKLTADKTQLQNSLNLQENSPTIEELKTLQNENEILKKDLEEFQKSLKKKSKQLAKSEIEEADIRIKDLESQLLEKDNIINELKSMNSDQNDQSPAPISNLAEELQVNINKLKIIIKEKDQEIKELTEKLNSP